MLKTINSITIKIVKYLTYGWSKFTILIKIAINTLKYRYEIQCIIHV